MTGKNWSSMTAFRYILKRENKVEVMSVLFRWNNSFKGKFRPIRSTKDACSKKELICEKINL